MENKNLKITIPVVVGIVFLIAGFLIGTAVQKPGFQFAGLQDLLGSKLVQNPVVYASGFITKISNNSITLADGGDSLEMLLDTRVKATAFTYPERLANGKIPPPEQKDISVKDLKIGDHIDATVNIGKDWKLTVVDITVLPQPLQ